jgi:hypothetical protein
MAVHMGAGFPDVHTYLWFCGETGTPPRPDLERKFGLYKDTWIMASVFDVVHPYFQVESLKLTGVMSWIDGARIYLGLQRYVCFFGFRDTYLAQQAEMDVGQGLD